MAEDAWIKTAPPPPVEPLVMTGVLWMPETAGPPVTGLLSDGWNGWGVDLT